MAFKLKKLKMCGCMHGCMPILLVMMTLQQNIWNMHACVYVEVHVYEPYTVKYKIVLYTKQKL